MTRIAAILSALCMIFLNICISAYPQEIAAPEDRYTLRGDLIQIGVDEYGARHLTSEGNVVLTYIMRDEIWTLNADLIEFVETMDNSGEPITQNAAAAGNIVLTGSDITVTAPGAMHVDIIGRRIWSDSTDIHVQFPSGELITEELVIFEESTDSVIVETHKSTEANYVLSDAAEVLPGTAAERSGSIFSDLTFDFSHIAIATVNTRLEITDGEPTRLDCPDPTVVTSSENTLRMPSSYILFSPPALHADDGAELSIGENINVHSDLLSLSYPESGGMEVQFTGLCAMNPGDDLFADQRVVVTHPAGTFSSDILEITVNDDGTHRIHATGCASFEIPFGSIEGVPQDGEV